MESTRSTQETPDFAAFVKLLRRLNSLIDELRTAAEKAGVSAPEDAEWRQLLRNMLMPQLDLPPLLVVAVVGGTNIGKSVVFNHLAGENASAATPLASGTKHPVCLVPKNLAQPELLQRLFADFKLSPWRGPEDSLRETDENLLFWRVGEKTPDRLLLIDAPDVDSDAPANWARAKAVRQSADVLLAILTQQKYNDAAVKKYFRAAAEADKPILVLFNQCDLKADRDYWPRWLSVFRDEIGATPETVYVAPHDRQAADELRLPFYDVGEDGKKPVDAPTDLRADLAQLRFDTIKIRTFRGAVRRTVDPEVGVPEFLRKIENAAGDFAQAVKILSAKELARVEWPALPTGLLIEEIRDWWNETRPPWSRRVHGFYRAVGRGAMAPFAAAWRSIAGEPEDPLVAFRRREREATLSAVEFLIDELQRLSQLGNDTLKPRLTELLRGRSRADLLDRVRTAHEALPATDDDYRVFLRDELNAWRENNATAATVLRSLDHVAALARPAISVALFFTGLHFAGDIVGQAASQAAAHAAGQLAAEAAITGGIAGGGEALVAGTSEGAAQAAARLFLRLQARYAQQRAQWLAGWLETELLGGLLADLRAGASAPSEDCFIETKAVVAELQALCKKSSC